jgi:FkbM family methyltransferase
VPGDTNKTSAALIRGQEEAVDSKRLLELMEKSISLSKRKRIERFAKAPKKILFSRVIKAMSVWSKRSIRIQAKTFWGENMLVVFPEVNSLRIYRYGFIEEALTKMAIKYVRSGMTFFDIGAHFGYFTLLSSHLIGREGKVHAFEPTLSSFEILKNNALKKNNIFVSHHAVLSKRKKVLLNDYGLKYSVYNTIFSGRLPEDISANLKPKQYEVESISIDDYVETNGVKPDFVKIDAESSEYEILLGMEKTIADSRPIIAIEVGDMGGQDVPESRELINYLIDRKYLPYECKEGRIIKHLPGDGRYRFNNILFLPAK